MVDTNRDNPTEADLAEAVAVRMAHCEAELESHRAHCKAELDYLITNWRAFSILDLVAGGLDNLRRHIEDPTEEGVSWESPFVELQIPAGPEAPPVLTTEPSDEDLSFEKVVETLAFKFLRVREATVLMELTGGAVIVRKDGTEFPVVPPELAEKMKTWPEKKRRRFEENYGLSLIHI